MSRFSPKPPFLYGDWKQCAWAACFTLSCFSLGSFAGLPGKHYYLESFLSFIARFYALPLDLTDFWKPRVQYNSTPSTSLILQPLEYTTLLHYSYIPNIHRKTPHTPSATTPKYTLPQRPVLFTVKLRWYGDWGDIENVRINGMYVLSGFNLEKIKCKGFLSPGTK